MSKVTRRITTQQKPKPRRLKPKGAVSPFKKAEKEREKQEKAAALAKAKQQKQASTKPQPQKPSGPSNVQKTRPADHKRFTSRIKPKNFSVSRTAKPVRVISPRKRSVQSNQKELDDFEAQYQAFIALLKKQMEEGEIKETTEE